MSRNRKGRGKRGHHQPPRAVDNSGVRNTRHIQNNHNNHGHEPRGRGDGRKRRWNNRQSKGFSPQVEEQYINDEEIVLDPEFSPLFPGEEDDPVDDLPLMPPLLQNTVEASRRQQQQQQSSRGNHKKNPFLQPALNHSPVHRQQHQQHQRQLQRINRQRSCEDCRAVRKANVRLRNVVHNHLSAAATTLVEWSAEVGVPFGGVADDEMDWQPEPEIRVVLLQQQQQQQQQQQTERRNSYFNNNNMYNRYHNSTIGGSHPSKFPVTSTSKVRRHRSNSGSGFTWWREWPIEPLEEEEGEEDFLEISPEEPMAVGPDPFRVSPIPGSGFTNYSGVSAIGGVSSTLFGYPGYPPIGAGR
ncbi:hypothetical protein PG990_001444 [Apiospora arundinis]